MVAPSAATSPSAPAPQSGDASLPRPTVHPAGDLPLLSPAAAPHAAAELLSDLTSPHHSLASVAARHNLTLDALLLWLTLPETREAIAHRESAAYTHVRLVASVNLSHAVHTTVKALETFNATPRPADPLDPSYLRASIHARKAAWLLYRFSRLTPLTDDNLAAARRALRVPLATDADASRHDAEPVRSTNAQTARADDGPARTTNTVLHIPTADPARGRDPTPPPQRPLPPQAPPRAPESLPDVDTLLAQVAAVAASLGIDISDLDDPNFDPALHRGPPLASAAAIDST